MNENDKHNNGNMSQEQLVFEIRRAMLEDKPQPDFHAEFDDFRKRNTPPARRYLKKIIGISMLAAAACIAAVFMIVTAEDAEESERHRMVMPGVMVYEATASGHDISVNVDGHTMPAKSEEARNEGIKLSADNEISFDDIVDGERETTTITIPQGKLAKIILSDSTKVWLSAGSHLIFPRRFIKGCSREVKLYGEAFFEVARDEQCPFIVHCENITTKVLGTQFVVRSFDGERPAVTLLKGSVAVSNNKIEIVLAPEKTASVNASGALVAVDADIEVATGWMNGDFYFDGQTLKQIMTEIGRWYNISVLFSSEEHIDTRLHFNASREWSIKEILKQLRQICPAEFVIKDGVLIVK